MVVKNIQTWRFAIFRFSQSTAPRLTHDIRGPGRAWEDQKRFFRTLLKAHFADAPDEQPQLENMEYVPVYAAFAVKSLLEALTDAPGKREAAERTMQHFAEMFGAKPVVFPEGEPPTPPSAA